jgi:hypothetical protein
MKTLMHDQPQPLCDRVEDGGCDCGDGDHRAADHSKLSRSGLCGGSVNVRSNPPQPLASLPALSGFSLSPNAATSPTSGEPTDTDAGSRAAYCFTCGLLAGVNFEAL